MSVGIGHNQPPEAPPPLRKNDCWYQVLQPQPVLGAQGQVNWKIAGNHTDMQEAALHAATIPGAAVMVVVCVFINPGAGIVAAQPAATQLVS